AAIVYLLLPAELRVGVAGATLLPAFHRNSGLLPLELALLALVGVAGLAVVPAVSELVRRGNEGLVRWTALLATVGYAVSAVSNFLTLGRLPKVADAYVAGNAATKAAIIPFWRSTLDWQGFWQFAAVGIWIFVVSLLALRSRALVPALAYAGLALGVLCLLAPIGVIQSNSGLLNVFVVLAIILSPIWYVWIGLVLWDASGATLPLGKSMRARIRAPGRG
ncbi:MAG TPA: DUF4386 family protein, partial [Ktedonobacterales bacterium]|nr:DUF4386 family protein [Ktedonobacterales bacterium]